MSSKRPNPFAGAASEADLPAIWICKHDFPCNVTDGGTKNNRRPKRRTRRRSKDGFWYPEHHYYWYPAYWPLLFLNNMSKRSHVLFL
ncbi:hypothetical protein N3K66_005735 [Trichothecium roseum]|uniref:Uncharacterized protein n=1 Tax=Trichothecium roseum TaxID=47278 RepID=A0ACC0UYQ0_9HYPO|nr:hypothetical protein N3K66_005735 [Trichothecium roseum]